MPLTLTRTGDRTCPTLTCDVCGERIRDAHDANLMWNPDDHADGEPSTAYLIAHKRACTPAADRMTGEPLWSTELALALYQLVRNAGMRPQTLERQAELQRALASL